MENREQNEEIDLSIDEVNIKNNLRKAKEKFKDLVKIVQWMRDRELREMSPN